MTLEAPIIKDKLSFIASGRFTYLDLLLRAFRPGQFSKLGLGFWDVNLKVNAKLGKKDRIYISGYAGRDNFLFNGTGLNYGNYTATVRWNHTFTDQLFANTTFIFSDYRYGYITGTAPETFLIEAGIRDFALKQDYNFYLNPKNTIRFGGELTYHQFQPSQLRSNNDNVSNIIADKKHATETAIYGSNEMQVTDKLKMVYGLRLSLFNQLGPDNTYTFDDQNNIVDTTQHALGQPIQTYVGVEPRLALTYQVHPTTRLELGYHRIHQYIHLLANSTALAPNDLWVPSTRIVKPQIADQVSLGVKQSFLKDRLSISLEGYYKYLQNQIDYEDGADILLNTKIESQILNGRGWSYGGELLVQANFGGFNGFLSYTLSRTMYQNDAINGGAPYLAKHDRTHDIAVVGTYALKKRWVFSLAWIYQTGNAVTLPSGKYSINGIPLNHFTVRNGYRMPASHRLDLAITLNMNLKKKFKNSLTLSIYNLYNQHNPYAINFNREQGNSAQIYAAQLSLFGIVPTLTWNFSF